MRKNQNLLTRSHRHNGFTIVELLIVIVVIGILAAITTVAYSGVSKRAADAKRIDDIAKIGKGLVMWRTDGKTMSDMNAGYQSQVQGWYFYDSTGSASYQTDSIHSVLVKAKLVSDGINDPTRARSSSRNYMLSYCTDATDERRVVMAGLDIPPADSVTAQLAGSGCTAPNIDNYVTSYGRNYARVF